EQIGTQATLQINPSGVLDLNGKTETIGNMTSGTVLTMDAGLGYSAKVKATGGGTLNLIGPQGTSGIVVTASGNALGSSSLFGQTNTSIEPALNLGGARRLVNVAGANNSQNVLELKGVVTGGTGGQINKTTSAGPMVMSNAGNSLGVMDAVQAF